jgi:hypothetical protein
MSLLQIILLTLAFLHYILTLKVCQRAGIELNHSARRLADTGRMNENPLSFALEIFATGYSLNAKNDNETLEREFHLYDALYAYLKKEQN